MHRSFLFAVFVALLSLANNGHAQTEQPDIKKILPPAGVWQFTSSIAQDAKGNMWFATHNGLFKYDGTHFTTYNNDPLNPSLASNLIESLCIDSKGNVWVGSDAGLSKLDPVSGAFINYHSIPGDTTSIVGGNVISLLEDDDGAIWIGTHKGLDRLDPKTGKFRHFYAKENDVTSLTTGEVSEIYKDRQGTLWIGTGSPFRPSKPGEGGLNKYNRSNGTFTRYVHSDHDATSLADSRVRAIFEDSKGNFWVGTPGDGLHIMDRSKGTFKRYPYDPADPSKLSRTPLKAFSGWDDFVLFINEDASGFIWIGTCNGMNRYDPRTGKTAYYSPEKNNPLAVSENIFWCSFTSRDGVFWIGDVTTSIYKIDILHSKIPYHAFNAAVNSVYETSPGMYWVGTEGMGLLQCDDNGKVQKKFVHDPSNPASISNDHIFIVRPAGQQKLWIGTAEGLNLLDTKTQKSVHYNYDSGNVNSLGSPTVNYVFEDKQNLWIGTQYSGLDVMNMETGKFTHYPHDATDSGSLGGKYVSSICEDSKGRLLVGIYEGGGGVNRLDTKTGKFFHYLKGSNITYLYKDHSGVVWVGTRATLYYFDVDADKMQPFVIPETNKYINNVLSIAEDKQHNLWLCTVKGLVSIDSSRKKIAIYREGYGVQENTFGYSDGMLGPRGNIIFCDQNGYYSFYPGKLVVNPKPPELVLTDFILQDQRVGPGKGSVLDKPLLETGEIHLNYQQNFFSVGFNVVDYTSRENDCLFMLENYDHAWRKGNADMSASYFNVEPGKYAFRVKVINSDGLTTEKQILIIISPPWWKTWWAYLLYTIVFTAAVWSFIAYRSRSLQQHNKILEHKVQLRTAEVQEQKEEIAAQRDHLERALDDLQSTQRQLIQSEKMASLGELTAGIAHEIQNPLNFVNNFSEVNKELISELVEEVDKGNTTEAKLIAEDIKENSEKISHHGKRADAIVKGMLQHSRNNVGQKESTDINKLCDEYLRLAYHGLRAKDKSFDADFRTAFDETIEPVNIVPQDIGRALLNIINNAFYAVAEKRKLSLNGYQPVVTVATKKLDNKVEIYVTDNGNGIPQNIVEKIFQPFFTTKPTGQGTGLGLSLSYDIVKAHGGEIKVETKVDEGISGKSGKGEGITFIIQLPIL